jgi:glyoxylase-like metal-dependent hydrolase (beta-lactamase superfamily II)
MLERHGVPADILEGMRSEMSSMRDGVSPVSDMAEICDGQEFDCGGFKLQAIMSPGHSDGQVCFFCREKRFLLAGDHLLPAIVPTINYKGFGSPNPLRLYLDSLQRTAKIISMFPEAIVLPGHGAPIPNGGERISQIIEYHRSKTVQISYLARQGYNNAFDICKRVFGDNLAPAKLRLVMGETVAYLQYIKEVDYNAKT